MNRTTFQRTETQPEQLSGDISLSQSGKTPIAQHARTGFQALADSALRIAARTWFVIAIAGQWTFVYYIAGFYAGPTIIGHFASWNRQDLITGYVAGDRIGNLYFASHVLMAALITLSGTLQILPGLRRRAARLHRYNGRVYILTAFLMALGGLWLIWARGTYLTLYGAASSTMLALSIMVCAAMTLRYALARKIGSHQRWALRTFLVANGVWFQRIGYVAWTIINQGPVGIGRHMDGPFDIAWAFGDFVLPLLVLQIYVRIAPTASPFAKSLVAVMLFGASAVTGIGSVGAYRLVWRPML